MNKRLAKRHKRHVARARERTKLSEPDVRTPEQLKAARLVSRAVRASDNSPLSHYSTPSVQDHAGPATEGSAKVDG